ncbi:MAG TPA: type VI secretion system protein TssA, partial [Pseudomonas sp.]|nr:type VI secretion system protein TssA [Pseudomonas sp.]
MTLPSLIATCFGDRDPLALARAEAGRWHDWLQPIDGAVSVGEDPAYNDDFQQVREELNKLSGADPRRV